MASSASIRSHYAPEIQRKNIINELGPTGWVETRLPRITKLQKDPFIEDDTTKFTV